jgi:hypothetical protein
MYPNTKQFCESYIIMSKIPIPSSFSTSPPGSPRSKPKFLGDRLEPPKDSSDRLMIQLNEQRIVQLESALQIYLYQNKKSSLSYTNMCTLVPKLVFASPMTLDPNDTKPAEGPTVPDLQGLSTEERLWHDFACVTVPRLYTLVERQMDSKTALQLHMVHHVSRPKELRRLLQEAQTNGVPRQLSAKILDWLQQDKIRRKEFLNAKTARGGATLVDKMALSKNSDEKVVQGPTTLQALEERVRAKAKERLRHFERAEQHAQTIGQQDNRIAVADGLYSHARKVLRQRKQGGSRFHTCTRPTKTSTQCRVPFSNLVQALPGYNRQQLSIVLEQIAEVCPDWISWTVKGGSKDTKQAGIPKNATVFIETANFKNVRAILSSDKVEPRESPSSVADQSPFAPVRLLEGVAERTPQQFPTASLRAVTVSGNKRSAMAFETPRSPTNTKKARAL